MTHFISVDFGGTQIRAARFGADLRLEARVAGPTMAQEGPEAVLRRIEAAIHEVYPEDGDVAALGVASPGPLDSRRGVILFASNLPGWMDVPLRDHLAGSIGVPTFVGNDANLAALGEHRFGAGRGWQDLVYLTISTGIGGGIVSGGCLFEGGRGLGGEVGHIVVEAEGPPCRCGARGCLEALAAGPAIARAARAAVSGGRESLLLDRVGGVMERISAREVSAAARDGDALAREVLDRAGFYIGVALTTLMVLLNPSLFIIGGSVARAGPLLFEPIQRTVQARAPEPYWRGVPILPAALGDDAGLMGALALALDVVGRSEADTARGDP